MTNMAAEERFYRNNMSSDDLVYYNVKLEQSDLYIGTKTQLKKQAAKELKFIRSEIKKEIKKRPQFLTSFYPLDYYRGACDAISSMYFAATDCGVGPMAAVAGAVAEYVGKKLALISSDVIVENGGDIYINSKVQRKVLLYAGQSSLTGKLAFEIPPGEWGICTSAYSTGHSYSDGRCDAAVVFSKDCALADAAATALGNSIKNERQLERGVQDIMMIDGVLGALAVINEKVAVIGELSLITV